MEGKRSTRLAESRSNEMLKQYNMEYVSPLSMPPGVAKEGFKYVWANKNTPHQVENLCRQGWEVVPSDRTSIYAIDPLKRNQLYSDFIWHKDAILMEIPEILAQRIHSYHQSVADEKIKGLQGVSTDTPWMNSIRGISSF